MPLAGEVFLQTVRNFRLCWIGGRYGGGKTALAVRLALEFYQRGWVKQCIGNFPCVLFTDVNRISDLRDCFIVFDEAGVWMNDRVFDDAVAFLRKRNLFVVMSSYLAPPTRARTMNVMRMLNGHRYGLNLWLYSAIVDYMRVKEKISLNWWRPTEVFGMWDTEHVAVDDGGIMDVIRETFYGEQGQENPRGAQEYGKAVPARNGGGELDDMRRVAETVYEATKDLEQVVSLAQRGQGRRRGRR